MSNWDTRDTLLQKIQAGNDEAAWKEFIELYQNFIYYILRQMNVPENYLDDLAQDVLVKLWVKLDKYIKERGKFRTWLTTVIRNTVIDWFTQEKKRNASYEELSANLKNLQSVKQSDFEKMVDKEWRTYLTDLAFERIKKIFSGKAIQVFEMSSQGVSVERIAEKLELNQGSVYTLKSRVKEKLIHELQILIHEREI